MRVAYEMALQSATPLVGVSQFYRSHLVVVDGESSVFKLLEIDHQGNNTASTPASIFGGEESALTGMMGTRSRFQMGFMVNHSHWENWKFASIPTDSNANPHPQGVKERPKVPDGYFLSPTGMVVRIPTDSNGKSLPLSPNGYPVA